MNNATNALFSLLALRNLDGWWQSTYADSTGQRLLGALHRALSKAAGLGSFMQTAAFAVVVLLFVVLVAPQFANDKEGLALIVTGAAVLWFGGYLLGGSERRLVTGLDIPLWIFFGLNIVATASSHYLPESVRGLLKLVIYMISYFLLTGVFQQSRKRKFLVVGALFLSALAESFYGFYQYKNHVEPLATWEDPTVEEKGTRIFGHVGNPNLLAGYLVPLAPLAASFAVSALQSARKNIPLFLGGGFLAVVFSVATILTGSRGSWFGLAAGLGAVVVCLVADLWTKYPRLRLPALIVALLIPIMIFLAVDFLPVLSSVKHRLLSVFTSEHSSNAYRMNVYRASLQMFKDSWWIGIGPGNQTFRLAYGLYMVSGFDALGTYCVPLEVAVEAGIASLVAFAALVLCTLARGHLYFWSKDSNIYERWLVAGASAALIGMMVHGLVDTVFYRPQVQFLFWLLIALISSRTEQNYQIKSD